MSKALGANHPNGSNAGERANGGDMREKFGGFMRALRQKSAVIRFDDKYSMHDLHGSDGSGTATDMIFKPRIGFDKYRAI